ncbi:MAG: hypothetical protein L0226_13700 [Acidobacteria bacterium]|nr:hypothetical protein [Acidobacteriota bacterium]
MNDDESDECDEIQGDEDLNESELAQDFYSSLTLIKPEETDDDSDTPDDDPPGWPDF